MDNSTVKYAVEGLVVPVISAFGFAGNCLAIKVLTLREVKLKASLVHILCGLSIFDNVFLVFTFFMFTMPAVSVSYQTTVLPYVAPYLLPATNTLMTCSVYATVAVALNRYMDIVRPSATTSRWRDDGLMQSAAVFVFSVLFNATRWFELQFTEVVAEANVTEPETGLTHLANVTHPSIKMTELRKSEDYIRWYTLGVNTVVMCVVPTFILVYSSCKVYSRLQQAITANLGSDKKTMARIKRNQSITRTLFGIIIMFLVCHSGKIVISFYEVYHVMIKDELLSEFAPWAKNLIVANTLLVVFNSSINFVIYCGDAVFRETLSALGKAGRGDNRAPSPSNYNGNNNVAAGTAATPASASFQVDGSRGRSQQPTQVLVPRRERSGLDVSVASGCASAASELDEQSRLLMTATNAVVPGSAAPAHVSASCEVLVHGGGSDR